MIKIIKLKKNYSEFAERIIEFYAPRYKNPFTRKTVENSAIICLALENEKIIGAVRAISDFSRHSLIVDLIVKKEHRKKGIGTKLLKSIISELRKENVENIGLTTDPKYDWLVDFYRKNGFEELKKGKYLELKNYQESNLTEQ